MQADDVREWHFTRPDVPSHLRYVNQVIGAVPEPWLYFPSYRADRSLVDIDLPGAVVLRNALCASVGPARFTHMHVIPMFELFRRRRA